MGKRADEMRSRQKARRERQVFAAPVDTQTSAPTPVYAEEKPPIKSMATCGQVKCCRAYAYPQLMNGDDYKWPDKMLASLPMPCAGTEWIPKPESKRKRETFAPGLAQFTKK